VTDPDESAALAAQLEELRGQLARTRSDLGHVRARLESESGQVLPLLAEVKRLRERLDEAVAKRQLTPPPAPWWCVGEAEGKAMLAELVAWVDTHLRRHYPDYAAPLPRCWSAHAEAVWELGNLHAEWQRIYSDPDNRDLQGTLAWHDRWLPGVLARLIAAIKCDETTGCRMARARPPPPRRSP
jgi:hypothetical protein